MQILSLIMLSLGLAMDATAAASARGMAAKRVLARDVVLVAVLFGGFQALMPLIGWFVGERFGSVVAAWDHWIAFVLLGGLGAKMLWEARKDDDDEVADVNPFQWRLLLVLAFATSIDALAAGLTLPLLELHVLISVTVIGVVTAALSALGVWLGRRFGAHLGKKLDVAGGLLLIAVGSKVLVEHLTAA
ncbi:MAG: manganese efflux pump MntP family protein [Archangium sp.]